MTAAAAGWKLRVAEGADRALPSPAGLLLGAVDAAARTVTLLGAAPVPSADASAKDIAAAAAKVLALLPHGAHVVGAYGCATPPPLAAQGAPAVGLAAAPGSGGAQPAFTLDGAPVGAPEVAPIAGLAPAGFVMVRCHCDVLLRVTYAAAAGGAAAPPAEALARAFADVERQLCGSSVAFAVGGGGGALLSSAAKGSLADALAVSSGGTSNGGSGGSSSSGSDPCPSATPLVSAAGAPGRPAAPAFEFAPAPGGAPVAVAEVPLSLDALALLPAASPAAGAAEQLAEALRRQLEAVEGVLAERLAKGGPQQQGQQQQQDSALVPVRAFHFRPPGWALPLTACYPRAARDAGAAEAALLPARRALHALLGLPGDAPLLRFANALRWGGSSGSGSGAGGGGSSGRLRDVHLGLPPPPIGAGAKVALVRGSYEYCHYMQVCVCACVC